SVVALLTEEDPDNVSGWAVSNKVRTSPIKVFVTGLSKSSPEIVDFIVVFGGFATSVILNYDGVKMFARDLTTLVNDKLRGNKKISRRKKRRGNIRVHAKSYKDISITDNEDGSTD